MDRALRISRRRRKWIVLLAVCGFSCYGAYKVYHFPAVARKRKRLMRVLGAVISVAELLSDSAETVGLVSRDLKEFLQSDCDEIPNSLKQLSKVVRSTDFTESFAKVSESLTVGIVRGCYSEAKKVSELSAESPNSSLTDKVTERIFSKAGTGFVSVVVGSFARNLVLGFYSNGGSDGDLGMNHQADSYDMPSWVNVLCDDRCKELIADCLQKFVSTAVAVYLEKTMNINTYDEIFAGLTNPKHRDNMRDILVSVCNGALETFVRTARQAFTAPASTSDSVSKVGHSIIEESGGASVMKGSHNERALVRDSGHGFQSNGWTKVLSSTLAVPSNRKFLFDVSGRVTFETLKSIVELLLWKFLDGFRRSFNVVHGEVEDRGRRVLTYLGAKSSIIVTVCLALHLHVLGSGRVFVPA